MLCNLETDAFTPDERYDVCVIGGGPAGLTAASALIEQGLRIIVIESGSTLPQARRGRISPVDVVGDDRYGSIEGKTSRALGGSSWHWEIDIHGVQGVRYTVIEPAVFDRQVPGLRSWPLDAATLEPAYQRALRYAGLSIDAAALQPHPARDAEGLDQGLYVFGPRAQFQASGLGGRVAERSTVLLGANAVELHPAEGSDHSVDHLEVRSRTGVSLRIRADAFVLSAGTTENTRLALALRERLTGLRSNQAIGVGLMDRPRITGMLTVADRPDGFESFAMHDVEGTWGMQRWLAPRTHVAAGGASCSFVPRPAPVPGRWHRIEQLVHRIAIGTPQVLEHRITDNAGRRIGRFCVGLSHRTYPLRAWLYRRVLRSNWNLEWSEWQHRVGRVAAHWSLTAIVEQFPDPANRIELTDERDELGARRIRFVWGRPITRDGAVDASLVLATEALERSGVGTVSFDGATFDAVSSCHIMGTLAFGNDPATSATDPTGLLRGTDNVFAAGMCLFPTSGHSNPTLTAMALSVRVADEIVKRSLTLTPAVA